RALADLLTPDATWRDLVAFTGTIKNWDGQTESVDALAGHADRQPRDFTIKSGTEPSSMGEGEMRRITAVFDHQIDTGAGSGVVQLAPSDNDLGWAAAHIMTELDELKDYPWQLGTHRPEGRGHGAVVNRVDPALEWAK